MRMSWQQSLSVWRTVPRSSGSGSWKAWKPATRRSCRYAAALARVHCIGCPPAHALTSLGVAMHTDLCLPCAWPLPAIMCPWLAVCLPFGYTLLPLWGPLHSGAPAQAPTTSFWPLACSEFHAAVHLSLHVPIWIGSTSELSAWH